MQAKRLSINTSLFTRNLEVIPAHTAFDNTSKMTSLYLAALFAGAAIAERPRPASCPEEVATVTETRTYRGASTVSDYSTYWEPQETWTRTLDAYNATVTITEAVDPDTTTIYDPDTTYTSFIATEDEYTTTCTETITT